MIPEPTHYDSVLALTPEQQIEWVQLVGAMGVMVPRWFLNKINCVSLEHVGECCPSCMDGQDCDDIEDHCCCIPIEDDE